MSVARVRAAGALAATALLLTACGTSAGDAGPTWRPKPSFNGEGDAPRNQQPEQQPTQSPTSGGASPSPSPSGTDDPSVVATRLNSPTGVAILPDNTALVGERKTGRIMLVQAQPKQPVKTIRTLKGLSTKGGGGLLDLALSPNYTEDNLIFAYLSTPTDNRVVAFTLHGPVTPVLKGIPHGAKNNTGRIAFGADGDLLIGTGDAGRVSSAPRPKKLSGKVLRVTDIGTPADGNPTSGSPVYATGFRRTNGLCVDSDTGAVFQTAGLGSASADDPIYLVESGGRYGWPRASSTDVGPLAVLPQTSRSPGGCAVLEHVLYTTSLDGKVLLAATIRTSSNGQVRLGQFQPLLRNKYGRLLTVAAATDGALWLTTSNRDGHGKPVRDDERVLRIVPSSAGDSDSTT